MRWFPHYFVGAGEKKYGLNILEAVKRVEQLGLFKKDPYDFISFIEDCFQNLGYANYDSIPYFETDYLINELYELVGIYESPDEPLEVYWLRRLTKEFNDNLERFNRSQEAETSTSYYYGKTNYN